MLHLPASNSDKQTDDSQSSRRLNDTRQSRGDGSKAKNTGKEDASSVLVTQRTKNEAHNNGPSNADNGRCPNFLLGQIQRGANLGKERRNGKPNEKCDKERPPRAVKGSHLRSRKVAELDFRGLVVLVRVDVHGIALVHFPFHLFS
jgi:hypothetical protein